MKESNIKKHHAGTDPKEKEVLDLVDIFNHLEITRAFRYMKGNGETGLPDDIPIVISYEEARYL